MIWALSPRSAIRSRSSTRVRSWNTARSSISTAIPQHPYTNGLFGSLPDISKDVEFLSPIEGLMPDPAALPSGCKFNPRCKYACPLCAERAPILTETEPGHFVRCLIYENALDVKEVVKYE